MTTAIQVLCILACISKPFNLNRNLSYCCLFGVLKRKQKSALALDMTFKFRISQKVWLFAVRLCVISQ